MKNTYFIKKRYIVVLLVLFGACIGCVLNLNLSVTIVELTSKKNLTIENKVHETMPEFSWSQKEKGLILSVFAYGHLCAPLGGLIASKIGGATTFGISIATKGVMSILSPYVIRSNITLFIFLQFLTGIFAGFCGASLIEVLLHWTPLNERSRSIILSQNGLLIGSTIAHAVSGIIIKNYGWEAVFFITGGTALVWYAIFVVLVRNTPSEDKYISEAERSYLMKNINLPSKTKVIYPWKSIFTSIPVWALLNEFFTKGWIYSFFANCLPLYISDVQRKDIQSIGLLSSAPNLCAFIGSIIAAFIIDYLRSKHDSNIQKIYKFIIFFGQISAVVLLIVTGLWLNFNGSIICFCLLKFCFSFAESAYQILPAELALPYAGFIKGMSITAMSVGLIVNPTIVGFMVSDHSRSSWNKYLLFISIFNMCSLVTFLIFGSAKLQPWAKPVKNEIDDGNTLKNTNFKEKA
ncbi:hypothetical protein PGB90_008617 [Kerria lacca]